MSDERPDTAALLAEVSDFTRRYVVLQGDHFYDAIALWVLHAHTVKAVATSPRLLVKSPEKESGKTRLLEVLEVLVPNPMFVMNTTISVLYRQLAEEQLTLLLDEADAIFNLKSAAQHEDLRALLNVGYRLGADVARMVGEGKNMKVKHFPVYSAAALAAIGNLPDTIESRSIKIPMRRRSPDEEVEPFRRRKVELEAQQLRERLAEWAGAYADTLSESEPPMPVGIEDRAADIWEPLIAIADLAGRAWSARARGACVEVVAGRHDEDLSVGVRLLVDVKAVMNGVDRISSAGLAAALNELEESGWGGWHDGTGMNQRDLAGRLRAYGISSKDVRLPDGTVKKGYERADFADAFARYLRDGLSATGATNRNTDPNTKDAARSAVALSSREKRERDEGQQALPLAPQKSATSATSATSYSKPVAPDSLNGSRSAPGNPPDDAWLDEAES